MNPPVTAAIVLAVLAGPPPDDEPKTEAERAAQAIDLAKREVGLYRLRLKGEPRDAPVLHPDALLQWSNPVAGSIHGGVFAWTDRGCPVAMASIFRWYSPRKDANLELNALTPAVESAERRGQVVWRPDASSIVRRPIPGAPRPAEAPAGRLRQLRALAAEFSARETTREGDRRDLRLLTQPIYRYQSTDPDVLDGGLFAFVQGTDPEIVLAIEARRTPEGHAWQFAAARVNSIALVLDHKGKEAWSVPTIPWDQAMAPDQPYTLYTLRSDDEASDR